MAERFVEVVPEFVHQAAALALRISADVPENIIVRGIEPPDTARGNYIVKIECDASALRGKAAPLAIAVESETTALVADTLRAIFRAVHRKKR